MPGGRGTRVLVLITILLMSVAGSTGCLARRRVITRKGAPPGQQQRLLTARADDLLQRITDRHAAISTFNATVDMVPALGSADKGRITEYKDVRAYVLYRKPSDIRLIGLYPVVRNKAFDMVANGQQFRLYIPAKNRFVTGQNELGTPSPNKLENLRPQHFLEALLVQPIDPAREKVLLENLTDEDDATYILSTVETTGDALKLKRQIWFDRINLLMTRQLIFDVNGDILTDARYSDWQTYDHVLFPRQVTINRPKDEYGVVLTIVKMDINKPLADDRFVLQRPEGTQLQVVGSPAPAGNSAPEGKTTR